MVQVVANRDLHRIVGVCFIYNEKGQFLITKRHPNLRVYPRLWTVPGGGMEREEYESTSQTSPDGWEKPLELSLRREIKEETGVEVGMLEYFNHFTFIRPDDIPVFGLRFCAPYLSGEVALDPEDSTEYAWITVDKVSHYEFLGNIPNELRALDAYLKAK